MSEEKKSDPNCLFCKMIAGAIPCNKVYETDKSLAFMDIFPLSPGHCLVIPKEHAQRTHELSEASMTDIGTAIHKVSKAVVAVTGCEDYNVLNNNGEIAHQVVKHVHYHIIPKPSEEKGMGIQWPSGKGNDQELKEQASKLAAAV